MHALLGCVVCTCMCLHTEFQDDDAVDRTRKRGDPKPQPVQVCVCSFTSYAHMWLQQYTMDACVQMKTGVLAQRQREAVLRYMLR